MAEVFKNNEGAKFICDRIRAHGYSAYLVGGCVRDAYMKNEPSDVDITVSSPPEKTAEILESAGCRVIPTGLKHGTVTALYDGEVYELTTMRKESGYSDGRHPESVEFVSDIESDLTRRDFTINAMAYSYETGSIIDIFGGREDIKNKLIRCVGEPSRRFREDALRILRALRFASRLGFEIEENTLNAMREAKDSISCLSAERVYSELCGLLCGKHAGSVLLKYADIIYPVIPELEACQGFWQYSKYHKYDVLEHICKVIDATEPTPVMRLSAFFHDVGKPAAFFMDEQGEGHFFEHGNISYDIAQRTLERLKADNKTKDTVLFLVKHHDEPIPSENTLIKKRINRIGAERFFMLCDIAMADCKGKADSQLYRIAEIESIKKTAQAIISEGECTGAETLLINGDDIISLSVPEGKRVGEILKVILDEVLSGNLENTKESLLLRATELSKK